MRYRRAFVLLLLALGASAYPLAIPIDTSSTAGWSTIALPTTARQSSFTVVTVDGAKAIHIESNDSASSLVYDRVFSTYETPLLHWSWKAMNVLAGGNAESRRGDDYAVRIYVMFPYEGSHLSLLERLRYEAGRQILGYYPPSEVLNYVWANRPHSREPLPNAFSGRGMMFFPDAGRAHLGEWRSHTVDLVEDYRRAYGIDPQETFRVAIMGDSDNTHGKTSAYIRDISVSSK